MVYLFGYCLNSCRLYLRTGVVDRARARGRIAVRHDERAVAESLDLRLVGGDSVADGDGRLNRDLRCCVRRAREPRRRENGQALPARQHSCPRMDSANRRTHTKSAAPRSAALDMNQSQRAAPRSVQCLLTGVNSRTRRPAGPKRVIGEYTSDHTPHRSRFGGPACDKRSASTR